MEPRNEPTLCRACVGQDVRRLTLAPPAQVDPDRWAVPVAPGCLDEHATYVRVAGLGDGATVHRWPARLLGGDEFSKGHERGSAGEATEVADLDADAHGRERLDPTQAPELANGLSKRWQLRASSISVVIVASWVLAHVERGEVVAVGGISGRLLEALRRCPQVEPVAPSLIPARIEASLAQQEALDPMLGRAAVVLDVLTHTHEIADRLFAGTRHTDRGQLACSMQTREVARVDSVGLDAGTGST